MISIVMPSPDLAIVVSRPSWLARILGARPSERFCVWHPSPGGARVWFYQADRLFVGRRVQRMIERAAREYDRVEAEVMRDIERRRAQVRIERSHRPPYLHVVRSKDDPRMN